MRHITKPARALALGLTLFASPLAADSQAIPQGAILTPTQIGHVFDSACIASVPGRMENRAEVLVGAFGFETIDLGTDAGWIGPNSTITVTVDGNVLEAACVMSVTTDLAGDGAELYDSLAAHLSEHLDGDLPTGEAIDNGLRWSWDGSNAAFTLDYQEFEDAFLISLTSEAQ